MRTVRLSLAVSLAVSATALFSNAAHAECSSVDTCQQTVKCSGGATLVKHPITPNAWFCQDKEPAAQVDPICKDLNGNSDWKFDKSARDCTRTRDNGVVVHTKENLDCPAGTTELPLPGKTPVSCQRPEKTTYTPPGIASPGGAARPGAAVADSASALRVLVCGLGAVKTTGGNYFCELHLPNPRVEDPTCTKFGGHDWKWAAGKKACERTAGGSTLTNTENISCKKPGTYNAGSGKCVTPKGTYYDEPILVKP